MRVDESHLVEESSGDTNDHVFNVRAYGTDAGELLSGGKPTIDLDEFLFDLAFRLGDDFALHRDVLEFACESTELSGNRNNTGFHFDRNCIGELALETKGKREKKT
jgi:hypothetical protein